MDPYRLPSNVRPTNYQLVLRTDLEKLVFEGTVKVSVDVRETTLQIVLNSDGLSLGDASVFCAQTKEYQVGLHPEIDPATKRASFSLDFPLAAGSTAEFKVSFSGTISTTGTGFLRNSFNHQGQNQNYAVTFLEPAFARMVFPCWDEPALKATFDIVMVSRIGTVNLSNMPVTSEEPSDVDYETMFPALDKDSGKSWKVTRFQRTPVMATYTLAMANGPFEFVESSVTSRSGKEVALRVYATPDLSHQLKFSLQLKARVLPVCEELLGEYPLPKLDTLIAVGYTGAMENWGLIIGTASDVALDPGHLNFKAKMKVAMNMSHEIAHMWFGNLTTMAWWNDLQAVSFLFNYTGFATLMGSVIIPVPPWALYPEFRPNSEFIKVHLFMAMSLDAKVSTHPIQVECPDVDRAPQIFDVLSYSKAASVLRMLANYVGEKRFFHGVMLYLKEHQYSNAESGDLWRSLSKTTGLDIENIVDNWITRVGFPMLTVTETPTGVHIRQDRFLETGLPQPENETNIIWKIPLSIVTVDSTGQAATNYTLMEQREQYFELDTKKPLKLNAGTTGLYRVRYTPDRMLKIAKEATKASSCFTSDDKTGLVMDATALSKAGLTGISSLLELIDVLRDDTEYHVWSSIAASLSLLSSVWWEDKQVTQSLDAFIRKLFTPIVERLGYESTRDEDANLIQLRITAVNMAIGAKDPKVIAELRRRFDHFLSTGEDSQIPADLESPTYNCAVRFGGVTEYEAVLAIHENPKTPSTGESARIALGQTQIPALLDRTMALVLNGSIGQDSRHLLEGLVANFKSRRLVSEFFMDNFTAIYQRYSEGFWLKYLFEVVFSDLTTEEDVQTIEGFFRSQDTSKYDLALAQALDAIRGCILFIERATLELREWLDRPKLSLLERLEEATIDVIAEHYDLVK
ncbi:leucyl aminopeptidase [Mycena floridula]|nr:leucyl aminopeptidase [Mycena floridula]